LLLVVVQKASSPCHVSGNFLPARQRRFSPLQKGFFPAHITRANGVFYDSWFN
jgi:hypothetical protein